MATNEAEGPDSAGHADPPEGSNGTRAASGRAKLLLLAAVGLTWSIFRDGSYDGLGSAPKLPLLFLAGAGAALVAVLLGRTLPAGARHAGETEPARGGPAIDVLAALMVPAAGFALATEDLGTYLVAAGAAVVLGGLATALGDLAPGAGRSVGRALVAVPVAVGSAALLGLGYFARPAGLRAGALEWMGEPFSGDGAPGLVLAGLALGLVLPGVWGGASAPLVALRGGRAAGTAPARALLGVAPALVLARGLVRLFPGADVLPAAGAIAALLAAVAVARGPRTPGARLASLVGGALAWVVAGVGTATPATADAAWIGLWIAGILAAALALATPPLEERWSLESAGGAPRGLGRQLPTAFLLYALAALALAGLPFLLPAVAGARALGEATVHGADREVLLVGAVRAPLLAVVALPLVRSLFVDRPGGRGAPVLPSTFVGTLGLGVAAGAAVAFGVVPDAPFGFAPHGSDPLGPTFPSALGGLEFFLGAMIVAAAAGLLRARDAAPRTGD